MSELLSFIIAHYAFLYDEFDCRIIDSQTDGFNAFVIVESSTLRLRFVRDRSQVFVDFQNNRRKQNSRWYSYGLIRQMVTGEPAWAESEELNATSSSYLREHFLKIKELFDDVKTKETEKTLAALAHERGEKLFGN